MMGARPVSSTMSRRAFVRGAVATGAVIALAGGSLTALADDGGEGAGDDVPEPDEIDTEGAVDGGKLRYKRRGEYGVAGGERGDLVVTTHVEEHPLFKRKGADVTMEVPVSVYEAALGCTVDVPTPGGATVRLKVPAGTQTGKKFRFKEMGAPDVKHRGRTGALLVEIKVQVPTNLSDDECDAMTKLRETDTRDYREKVNRYKATY